MADNLLDNYNPLYDIHLRQYFALPHMQKHLQKMGLLESTLNLNGDEVYARHHAMMDMMLKNREAQLVKMAELRKKLDAAEKVECCRRIRTGQSPESYRQGKPSRSLSRNRAGQKNNGSGGRQRRYSNSFEDRDFVQRIEERNAEPLESNTRDPYKRLSANAKRFNYLHKLDDNTLVAYKDNLKKQLQRLERFREISFGPHSVARQPPPPQTSWFFRRRSLPSLTASAGGTTLKEPLRSVLNMRGRKATTGNKLNASHDSRTSCPPTTRKRKDSNVRLPPIHPPSRQWVPTKPPVPVSIQQTTTKLPPAAKKPAPTRGRPSTKRQTTTTTITTVSSVSKSPPKEDITTTTLPTLPSVTGHGIFTGAAAATAAAIGTVALNVEDLIASDSEQASPVSETRGTHGRNSPAHTETIPIDNSHELEESAEKDVEQVEEEHVVRQIESINAANTHGDYEDSSSEPEYAEEDKETPVETEAVALGVTDAIVPEPFSSDLNQEDNHAEEERSAEPHHDEIPNTESQSLNRSSSALSDIHLSIEKPTDESTNEPPSLATEKTEEESEEYRKETPDRVLSVNDSVAHYASEIASVPEIDDHGIEQNPKSPVEKYDHHEQLLSSPVRSLNSSPVLEAYNHSPPKTEDYSEHEFENSEHSPLVTSQNAENSQLESPTLPDDAHYEQEGLVVQNPITVHEQSEPNSPKSPVVSHHESHHSLQDLDTQNQPPVQLSLDVNNSEPLEQTDSESLQSPEKTEIFEEKTPLDASESPVTKRETPEPSDRSMSNQNVSPSLEQEVGFERAMSVHSQASNDQEHSPSFEAPAEEFLAEENISTTAEHLFASEEKSSGMGSPTVEQVDESSSLIPSQEEMKNHPFPEHSDVDQQELMSPVHDNEYYETQEAEKQDDVLSVDDRHQHHEEMDLERSTIMEKTNEGAHESTDSVDQVSQDRNNIRQESAEPVSSDNIMPEEPENIVESVEEERRSPDLRRDSPAEVASSEFLNENSVVENLSDNVDHSGLDHEISHEPVEIIDVPIDAPLSRKSSHVSDNHDVVASSPENIAAESEFVPRNPSVHTSDAEEEHENMKHGSSFSENHAPKSPTEMDLYNPSREDVDSPIMSDSSPREEAVPFTEDKNITAYQDSETRESTSPVPKATEETKISIEQVAQHIDQHPSPKEEMVIVDTISNPDNGSSSISQSKIEQTDSIGNVDKEEDEHVSFQHLISNNPDADLMTTSVYQSGSYQENEMSDEDHLVHRTNQSDEKNERFLESSDAMDEKTVQEQSTVKDSMILDEDNISTDSLSIHDQQPNPMMQSIYQPQSENEDDDGDHQTDHVQTTITEKTDESGRHYKETVTSTTTTVIKSGDDLENNNDEEDHESGDKEQIIEEEKEHGSNGNLVKETITTTTTTITSGGFPEGGILVDDGDESNISSI